MTERGTISSRPLMAAQCFLFVHGAWHGAWSFDLLRLELERRAVACEAIDLPALGDDHTALPEATFELGVDRIVDHIGTRRNWILVGHSFGGFYVTEAALRTSGKVRSVVYLAGYVPRAGDDFATLSAIAPISEGFRACFTKNAAGDELQLDAARAKPFLYHDVAAGIALAATTRLRPQPAQPFEAAKIDGTAEALKKIPRTALIGASDCVLRAEHVVAMAARAEVPQQTIVAGHCPFLSAPKRVADLLLGVQ